MKQYIITAVIAALVAQGVFILNTQQNVSNDEVSSPDYFSTTAKTLVSPHSIRKRIHEGNVDFILVDVRSYEEYVEEHAVGAVSIPAYVDRENSAKTDRDRIIADFQKLIAENPDKEIIIYCYSSSCMTGRKIGNLLEENNIHVKEMTVGWNEWRYFWKQWNYPHEWENINPLDYVATGTEPGVFDNSGVFIEPCNIDNEFGC